jgi:class 3 adenylate cyclase
MVCPVCQLKSDGNDARFCKRCGSPLTNPKSRPAAASDGESQASIPAPKITESVEGNLKDLNLHAAPDGTVTLLFSDIEASTSMWERLGDIKASEVLRDHNALMDRVVHAHGGFVVKSTGDGFFVTFGRVRPAVLCAIAIQRALEKYCADHPAHPLRVRIGLHTGEARLESNDYLGNSVNLAARVMGKANGGEILVSSTVKDVANDAGDLYFDPGRDFVFKGFAQPRRAYRLAWKVLPSGQWICPACERKVPASERTCPPCTKQAQKAGLHSLAAVPALATAGRFRWLRHVAGIGGLIAGTASAAFVATYIARGNSVGALASELSSKLFGPRGSHVQGVIPSIPKFKNLTMRACDGSPSDEFDADEMDCIRWRATLAQHISNPAPQNAVIARITDSSGKPIATSNGAFGSANGEEYFEGPLNLMDIGSDAPGEYPLTLWLVVNDKQVNFHRFVLYPQLTEKELGVDSKLQFEISLREKRERKKWGDHWREHEWRERERWAARHQSEVAERARKAGGSPAPQPGSAVASLRPPSTNTNSVSNSTTGTALYASEHSGISKVGANPGSGVPGAFGSGTTKPGPSVSNPIAEAFGIGKPPSGTTTGPAPSLGGGGVTSPFGGGAISDFLKQHGLDTAKPDATDKK